MIEGRQRFISTYIIDPEEAAEDGVGENNAADLDEEVESGLREVRVSTGVAEAKTEEAEDAQKAVKYASIS